MSYLVALNEARYHVTCTLREEILAGRDFGRSSRPANLTQFGGIYFGRFNNYIILAGIYFGVCPE